MSVSGGGEFFPLFSILDSGLPSWAVKEHAKKRLAGVPANDEESDGKQDVKEGIEVSKSWIGNHELCRE